MKVDIRIGLQELRAQVDESNFGHGDMKELQKSGGNPFVHQNPPVLRVIDKLDDVESPIIALQQVRLGAAAHLADQAPGINRHGCEKPAANLLNAVP